MSVKEIDEKIRDVAKANCVEGKTIFDIPFEITVEKVVLYWQRMEWKNTQRTFSKGVYFHWSREK